MTTREDMQTLLRVAQWILDHKPHIMSKIRQIADTEENYLIIARELDRVNGQIARARTIGAEATLTLLDWLIIVDSYDWKCAYCREKPFEVMCHHIPLSLAGTTPFNCVPACYSCCRQSIAVVCRITVRFPDTISFRRSVWI